jgi:hypothetical protein
VGPLASGIYAASGGAGDVTPFDPNERRTYADGNLPTKGLPASRKVPPAATLLGGVTSMTLSPPGSHEVVCGTSECLMYRYFFLLAMTCDTC